MTNTVVFPGLGLTLHINRVAFTIGGLNIYWYGICIALGLALGLWYMLHKCRDCGINDDHLIDVVMLSTVCAIIGARAYYVVFAPFSYTSLWEVLDIRNGGVAIYGAVIAAFLSGWLFCKWRKVPVLQAFDLTAVGFLIGQGIGRWGNFFNQEAFGTNTTGIFGMKSEATQLYLASVKDTLAAAGITVDPSLPVHPTFLYESVWCLLGALLLILYFKHRKFNGEVLLLYVMWYGLERAFVEGLRTDSLETVFGVRVSQLVAVVSTVVALALWILLRRKYKDTPLTVTYTFPVRAVKGKQPEARMEMTWDACRKAPTPEEVDAAYDSQQRMRKEAAEKAAREAAEKAAAERAALHRWEPVLPVGLWHASAAAGEAHPENSAAGKQQPAHKQGGVAQGKPTQSKKGKAAAQGKSAPKKAEKKSNAEASGKPADTASQS